MRKLLALAALLLGALAATPPAAAQSDSTATIQRLTDSVAVRAPAPGALAEYRNDPAFQYEAADPAGVPWWERLRRWLWETLFAPVMGPLGEWQRPLMYVLLGAALVFAFVQFVRMRSGGAWKPPARRMGASFQEIEENLEEADLAALVEEAVRAGDRRRAVRLLYLRALRALADAGRIAWDPAKTNRAYVREMAVGSDGTRDERADELAALTRLFERIWYGHADVTPATFERLRPRFERFRQRVKRGEQERGRAGEKQNAAPA